MLFPTWRPRGHDSWALCSFCPVRNSVKRPVEKQPLCQVHGLCQPRTRFLECEERRWSLSSRKDELKRSQLSGGIQGELQKEGTASFITQRRETPESFTELTCLFLTRVSVRGEDVDKGWQVLQQDKS